MQELRKEIEKLLVALNNKYCDDEVTSIWDANFLITPNEDNDGIVETKLVHIFYEYIGLVDDSETILSDLESIREELKTL